MNRNFGEYDPETASILLSKEGVYRNKQLTKRLYIVIAFLCFLIFGLLALILWMYIQYIA